MKLGWIGIGRMGSPMAARLIRAGYPVVIWNRTRTKAESEELKGAKVAASRSEFADVDALFTMLSTGQDVIDVCFGSEGVFRAGAKRFPRLLVDCSTISMAESAEVRARLDKLGVQFLAAPVSGNPKCVRAGKLSCVVSGPREAFVEIEPALLSHCCAWGCIRGRRRAGANVQDCGQSPSRCRQREHDGGHVARPKGGRSSTCFS